MSFVIQSPADVVRYQTMSTAELRASFLAEGLFRPGEVRLVLAVETDRVVIGSASPLDTPLDLPTPEELRASSLGQRRELGIINLGSSGWVAVDQQEFSLGKTDMLYVGRGSRSVRFGSHDADSPARFYLMSFPAHEHYPTTLIRRDDARRVDLGSDAEANRRTIYQAIHPEGVESCQLVMGWTELPSGHVWNTMPPHTHQRRSEVYLYFDLAEEHRVMHLMGMPQQTRVLWAADGDAIFSPPWSIHCGCGTSHYSFVWGMGGENQRFDDMDPAPIVSLR